RREQLPAAGVARLEVGAVRLDTHGGSPALRRPRRRDRGLSDHEVEGRMGRYSRLLAAQALIPEVPVLCKEGLYLERARSARRSHRSTHRTAPGNGGQAGMGPIRFECPISSCRGALRPLSAVAFALGAP